MGKETPFPWKPAIIGGTVAGIAGSLPIVQFLNCACCALVIGGGLLAAFLQSKECRTRGVEFGAGGGAIAGLVAAPFYALASAVVGTLVSLVTGATPEAAIEQIESMGMTIPPEAQPWIDFVSSAGAVLWTLFSFVFGLLVALVFSTVGGLIGGAAFKAEPPAPAPPPPPIPAM